MASLTHRQETRGLQMWHTEHSKTYKSQPALSLCAPQHKEPYLPHSLDNRQPEVEYQNNGVSNFVWYSGRVHNFRQIVFMFHLP